MHVIRLLILDIVLLCELWPTVTGSWVYIVFVYNVGVRILYPLAAALTLVLFLFILFILLPINPF